MSNDRSPFLSSVVRHLHKQRSKRETQGKALTVTTLGSGSDNSTPDVPTEIQPQPSDSTARLSTGASTKGALAVPALGNDDYWKFCRPEPGSKSLADATEKAASLCERLTVANDPLDSAGSAWNELCVAREQLQVSFNCASPLVRKPWFRAVQTLGNIYELLGDYDMAEEILYSACPRLPLTQTAADKPFPRDTMEALLSYLRVATTIGRDLARVEECVRVLPWILLDRIGTEDCRHSALFSLIRTLNYRGCHEDASTQLKIFEAISSSEDRQRDADYLLQKAIATACHDPRSESHAPFVDAFIVSSSMFGIWHRQTLEILHHFARALKALGLQDAPLQLLAKACHGSYYASGVSHPQTVRMFEELQTCEDSFTVIQSLRQLTNDRFSRKRAWSVAFEHSYLITPIELLNPIIHIDFDRVSRTLEGLDKRTDLNDRARYNIRRNLAWCAIEQNRLFAASTALSSLYGSLHELSTRNVAVEAFRATLAIDEAICSAKGSDRNFLRQRTKSVYSGFKEFPKERSYQTKALLRRMTEYRLTHFTRDEVYSGPSLLIETNREPLGSGSSATVDTVKIGQKSYARKSINLPRQMQRQRSRREDIQKEIKIFHALDHPHVVRVLLTYEETSRFSIIMLPLADCDLETFLANNTCKTNKQISLVSKWMVCLVNTLAYIHSKNIRHRDIKPRNVLVKGEKIYFTDFGSGHIFDDGGNSTTDGISYGHTRAYCAPEVIRNESRNRSSDVFSLGCVLVEMAVWSSGIVIQDYFDGIRAETNSTDIVSYHDSTARIRNWIKNTTLLTHQTRDVCDQVLAYMTRRKPEMRWTAVQVSNVLSKLNAPAGCTKCGIDLWVSSAQD